MDITVSLIVNGKRHSVTTDPQRSLLDVLREDLGYTGPKYGCGEGRCGSCSVLIDGRSIRSCTTAISAVDNKSITTIEGLATGSALHPAQEAFLEEGAVQCGYCTGGMIVSTVALLDQHPDPTDDEIVKGMEGHICRCNGYPKIVQAIRRTAKKLGGKKS